LAGFIPRSRVGGLNSTIGDSGFPRRGDGDADAATPTGTVATSTDAHNHVTQYSQEPTNGNLTAVDLPALLGTVTRLRGLSRMTSDTDGNLHTTTFF
jgi:hypothetical protein